MKVRRQKWSNKGLCKNINIVWTKLFSLWFSYCSHLPCIKAIIILPPPPFPSSQKNHNYQTNMIFQKHISSFSFLSFWKNVKFYADFYWIVRLYIVNMNFVFFQDVWEFRGTRSQTSLTGYQLLSTGFQSVAPSSRVRTKNPLIIKWFPNPPGSENQRMVI